MNGLKVCLSNLQDTFNTEELNFLRMYTHNEFDRIWKNKYMKRSDAYAWLAKEMNIPKEKTHIALFDRKQCQEAREIVHRYLHPNKTGIASWDQEFYK
jgi:hypothetical protein